ncbi:GTP-binding protein 2-like [Zerene cesonia]|uniref:GTP-binding protein 2-like n=1 Tax=Zerene cesonia TaxID=33412 RepID=UPI0018E4EE92|nr:GTP-binding protein 2-like [Zerene cesonia]
MESFFSLFDPSDGQSRPTKKKYKNESDRNGEMPKGRRRGRRLQGKNETLPEESSFLCEPDLSTELLVKDCSYIENYIEVNAKEDDQKDSDKKPRRRNSGRKNRRKRNKISPAQEFLPGLAWAQDGAHSGNTAEKSLNNQASKPKHCVDKIGKNVNNLKTEDPTREKRRDCAIERDRNTDTRRVYNVIDKLEKVGIKDNMYLAGDFDDDNLGSDFFYSDDEMEDFRDDSTSDADDTGDECYGSLPPEPRFGNVEYKLQLASPCERRFQHLVTQLKWRLRSGGGTAVYVIGVRDCGALRGLRAPALRASLRSLRRMAAAIGAALVSVRARRVASNRAVAEVYIRKLADTQQSVELRVAVMGANEAGKSTLIGVLTQGELDNGRGSARLNMFRHLHEVKSGRTSSLSHEILGFDAQGNVVNYGCSELMTAERIGERSAKLVSFLDLAGHSKYQRTTLHGLTGYCPHYAMLVISATAGITSITEEHIGLLLALDLPFFVVISKCELASGAVPQLMEQLNDLLVPAKKKPLLITDENLARNCVVPQKSILDAIDQTEEQTQDEDTCEFQIDEIFHVGDASGPVVGGLVARGRICEGDDLVLGEYVPSITRTHPTNIINVKVCMDVWMFVINLTYGFYRLQKNQNQDKNHKNVRRKNTNLLQDIANVQNMLTKNLHLDTNDDGGLNDINVNDVDPDTRVKDVDTNVSENGECDINVKDMERDVNVKSVEHDKNVKVSSLSGKVDKMTLKEMREDRKELRYFGEGEDKVWLEDPNNPRGCIYFQATVHVIRHATAINPGFQCSVHVGNVRQTAIIEGIFSPNNVVRAGETASVVFRFLRCPEYLVSGRRLLFTAGLGTRAIGRVTQTFPYIP